MNLTDIYAVLTRIFKEVLQHDDLVLSPELTNRDVDGWDSITHVEILFRVEEHYGITLSSAEIDALGCVGDLANQIARKVVA